MCEMCENKRNCLACYQEGENSFEPWTSVTTNSFILHIDRSFPDDKMENNRIDFDKSIN